MYQVQGIAQEPSSVGKVILAADELQKIIMGLENSAIALKMRLIPVLRPEEITPSSLEKGHIASSIPLEEQLLNSYYQAENILNILDGILKRLEV